MKETEASTWRTQLIALGGEIKLIELQHNEHFSNEHAVAARILSCFEGAPAGAALKLDAFIDVLFEAIDTGPWRLVIILWVGASTFRSQSQASFDEITTAIHRVGTELESMSPNRLALLMPIL